ncbi:MAG: glycoside hydrolase family 3 C-terminal domain-containing protein, partial [Candidatus Promineifilaceae bacterium]
MHAQRYLLTDVLKGELGFNGFLVTDWEAIDQIDEDFYVSVVQSINAGIDMNMVPFKYHRYIALLTRAVENGDVPMSRIDDAVRRILRVKLMMGLFETPNCETPIEVVGCAEHRALAREAVQKSAVLLKNDDDLLPLPKDMEHILVAGAAAHDVGYQCGGWSIEWMGKPGAIAPGATILEGMKALSSAEIVYDPAGAFDQTAPVGLVVIAENPYAEGMGDRTDLTISAEQITLIETMRKKVDKLIVVLMSGRPMIITDQLPLMDAFVAAFLPGTEGDGLSDVIFGEAPFTGTLSFHWPHSMQQVPLSQMEGQTPLFKIGDGLVNS